MTKSGPGTKPSARPPTLRRGLLRRAALCSIAVALAFAAACTSGAAGVTTQAPPATDESPSVPVTTPSSAPPSETTSASPSATSDSTQAPWSPSQASTPPSKTAPTTDPGPTTESSKPSSAEIKDRAAIEAAWTDYFKIGTTLWKQPQSQWKSLLGAVAVDPVLTRVLGAVAASTAQGKHDYGLPVHHPYWQVSVDGKDTATMGDCMDDSNTGSMDAKTGKKLTKGPVADNTSISAVKINGTWKIANFIFLTTVPCPAD